MEEAQEGVSHPGSSQESRQTGPEKQDLAADVGHTDAVHSGPTLGDFGHGTKAFAK
jgi:hypothetical protein